MIRQLWCCLTWAFLRELFNCSYFVYAGYCIRRGVSFDWDEPPNTLSFSSSHGFWLSRGSSRVLDTLFTGDLLVDTASRQVTAYDILPQGALAWQFIGVFGRLITPCRSHRHMQSLTKFYYCTPSRVDRVESSHSFWLLHELAYSIRMFVHKMLHISVHVSAEWVRAFKDERRLIENQGTGRSLFH